MRLPWNASGKDSLDARPDLLEGLITKIQSLAKDDVEVALRAVSAAHKRFPNQPRLKELEATLQEERRLAERYENVVGAMQRQEWMVAREALNSIAAERPDYRDVAELQKQVFTMISKQWAGQRRAQEAAKPPAPAKKPAAAPAEQPAGEAAAGGAAPAREGTAPAAGPEEKDRQPSAEPKPAKRGRTPRRGTRVPDSAGKPEVAKDEKAADDRAKTPAAVVVIDEQALAKSQLEDLVVRFRAASGLAAAGDWATALYILEGLERLVPALLPANRRVVYGLAKPANALEERVPKYAEIMELLKRARTQLGVPAAAMGVTYYRAAWAAQAAAEEEVREGTFTLRIEAGQLLLTVTSPRADGHRVELSEVEAELGDWPVAPLDAAAVQSAVEKASGEPVVVGSVPLSYLEDRPPADGLGVVIAPDEMTAHLVPSGPATKAALSVTDVQEALASAGVVAGLVDQALAEFATAESRSRPMVAARGVAPRQGSPPRVVAMFEVGKTPRSVAVEASTKLLSYQQTAEGIPGQTVTGREIPAEGEPWPDLASLAGPGTAVARDGQSIVATIRGNVQFEGHRVSVIQPGAERREEAAEGRAAPKVVPGRPTFGPGRKWVELSALNAQVARVRAGELLGAPPADLDAREIGAAAARYRETEAALRSAPKRYRVQRRSIEGRFELQAHEQGLDLVAWPPEGGGRATTWAQVQAELGHWPPLKVSQTQVEVLLREAKGQPVRIAPSGWLSVPCGTGALGARLSDDEMMAHVIALGTLRRGPLDEGTVRAALARAGVTHGIVESELALFCQAEERARPVPLAFGTPPDEISDPLEYLFPRDERAAQEVLPGTMLAWNRPVVAAASRTVTGKLVTLPAHAPPSLAEFVGEGTALEARGDAPGGQAIAAAVAGRPTVTNGHITVFQHTYVTETVKGRVSFNGSVTVKEIAPGAQIRARGDVTLESDAEEIVIEAGGSVRLQGVRGTGKARINTGGAVAATWLRGCLVMAQDAIHVGSELLQSKILASRRVTVDGDGVIDGGLVRATDEIVARTIRTGDPASPTRIILGKLGRGSAENSTARLIVREEIEPGVRISIDGATLDVKEPIRRAVLRQRGGVIQVEGLAA